MNKKDKEDRYLELEKQAIDNFLEVQMDFHGISFILSEHLNEDEEKEYYQLEKELYG